MRTMRARSTSMPDRPLNGLRARILGLVCIVAGVAYLVEGSERHGEEKSPATGHRWSPAGALHRHLLGPVPARLRGSPPEQNSGLLLLYPGKLGLLSGQKLLLRVALLFPQRRGHMPL